MILPEEKIKEILINRGVIDEDLYERSKEDSKRLGIPFYEILIQRRLLDLNYFYDLVAEEIKVPRISLKNISIPTFVLSLVPERLAFEKKLVPFALENDVLKVGMVNPLDLETIKILEEVTHKKIEVYLITPEDLRIALINYQRFYAEEYKRKFQSDIKTLHSAGLITEESTVSLVNNLIGYAFSSRASDIHIEPLEKEILVRFRIDGVLREIMRLPKEFLDPIIARIKVISNLQLDEHFRPQDGRFKTKISDFEFDIRVAIMPTLYGEKAVLRILSGAVKPTSLDELGMVSPLKEIVLDAIKKTFGMILVTGPTGSGKTTTLYTIINILNKPEVNIVTIEDPIEYAIPYVNQTQVNPKVGLNFAVGLRAFLRQDPDIIMVGEIRDAETADVAVQAALTGHLVLSTLHTNDAPTAIPRLIDLGIPHYLVADSLTLILAQRLVRKICPDCIVSEEISEYKKKIILEQLKTLEVPQETFEEYKNKLEKAYLFRGKGCQNCGYSGYRERTAIFEGVVMNDELREIIASKEFTLSKIKEIVRRNGYKTMFEDGLEKVLVGITTVEEVLRVIRE
ncbi:MAG: GspE/PulE family protein [Minisyncoccia bacterium]|jgi:type IV pilus assembly protein PilB